MMTVYISTAIKQTICVLGGTGFVGQHLIRRLIEAGYQVKVLSRHRERHRELLVLPGVDLVEVNIHNPGVLNDQLAGCNVVINLVAIINERQRGDFRSIHVGLTQQILQACKANNIKRLLHMSSVIADAEQGKSQYAKTKGQGEDILHDTAQSGLEVTSFRPSVIFGPDDHFFNRFAGLLKIIPIALPLACPSCRFAPIYVEDVCEAFIVALKNRTTIGQRYELCGPRNYTMMQLVEFTANTLGLKRKIIGLSDGLSRLQAHMMGHLPGKPFSYDNYLSLQDDNVCQNKFPELFAIKPKSIEEIVPIYLLNQNRLTGLDEIRYKARHSA